MKKLLLAASLTALSFTASADWNYSEQIDLMTDKDNSFVYQAKDRNGLVVRCTGDEPRIIVKFDYLGEANRVLVRFDKEDAMQLLAPTKSTTGVALFLNPGNIPMLIESMKKYSTLAIQTTDYLGTPKSEVYSLSGFTSQVNKLSCVN